MLRSFLFALSLLCLFSVSARAENPPSDDGPYRTSSDTLWEWSIPLNNGKGRAFLWIPPHCDHLRGVIIAREVVLEENVCQDPIIRAAAEKENLAIVFIVDGIGLFDYSKEQAEDKVMDKILQDLADKSGYKELAHAPLLPVGHSGGGIFVWNVAYGKPKQVFAGVSLKSVAINPPNWDSHASAAGIPFLCVNGQYEMWDNSPTAVRGDTHMRWLRGTLFAMRGYNPDILTAELAEPGATHFGWYNRLARVVAMFIQHAAEARLPDRLPDDGSPATLKTVSKESGWLTDYTLLEPTVFPAAPYDQFKGDPALAFWHLDEEMARTVKDYMASGYNKKEQLVTWVKEDGTPIPNEWGETIALHPEADGVTFRVKAAFVDKSPACWPPTGHALSHAEGAIQFRSLNGGVQISPDELRIRPDPMSLVRHSASISAIAYKEPDDTYNYTEQVCRIDLPGKITEGKPQKITFNALPAWKLGDTQKIELKGTSDSGLPVGFAVLDGPAQIKDNVLTVTDIPPNTKFPVEINVVAYQWGSLVDPKVQSADSITQTILIQK